MSKISGPAEPATPRPADKHYRCPRCKHTIGIVEGPINDPNCIVCHKGGLEIVSPAEVKKSRTKGFGCG